MTVAALDLLWALVLEDGRRWGDASGDWPVQQTDAEAIMSRDRPNWHFITRPRGGSKSTDIAGVALAWLVAEAPPLANGHIVAASTDQASIVIDAAAGLVARTPELDGAVVVETKRLLAPNGAWVEVLAQSDSGAWGLRDAHLLVADEFCQWPETRGAKRVWTALISAAPKVPGCRLIVLTSSGEPSHWSHEVFEKCRADALWRVSEAPGPVPWLDEEELAGLRWQLRPSEYERLVLNVWSEDEDRAVSEEDWEFAAQEYLPQGPRLGTKYLMTVDIGILNDATVMCIGHKEAIDADNPYGPARVVVDHLERWKGSKKAPIQIREVEAWVVGATPMWNDCEVWADPTQFQGSLQFLNTRGVRAKEFTFSTTSVGQVATAMVQTFRNHQIHVPNNAVLRDELLSVRLRESAPGVTRLDHDPGAHDDQAVAIGMLCHKLLGVPNYGYAWRQAWEMEHAEDEKAKEEEPVKRRARSFFLGDSGAPLPGNPTRCEHRWFSGSCAHCGLAAPTA
jgi:hypothetical protein